LKIPHNSIQIISCCILCYSAQWISDMLSESPILEACGSSIRLGKTASKILERPKTKAWCSCLIDASPFTGLYVTVRFSYLLFSLCRVDFICRVLVGWGLPLQFMVYIHMGFVTRNVFHFAVHDWMRSTFAAHSWMGFIICSSWNLSYDIYGLSVQIGTSLTIWMSLPSFVNRHVVVWWDIWQCGEDARIWNFNDVERTAVGSMPVATRQSSSGFLLNLEVWQPPRQLGKASMHKTVTQALYFLLSFFWKDTVFSFLRFLLQAAIGDRCSSNTEFEALLFRRK